MKRLRYLIRVYWDWLTWTTNVPKFWNELGDPRPSFREFLAEREADKRAIEAYEEWQHDPSTARLFETFSQELGLELDAEDELTRQLCYRASKHQDDTAQPPQGQ